jgi:hypothetical protein
LTAAGVVLLTSRTLTAGSFIKQIELQKIHKERGSAAAAIIAQGHTYKQEGNTAADMGPLFSKYCERLTEGMIDSNDCIYPYCYIDTATGQFFAGLLAAVEVRYVCASLPTRCHHHPTCNLCHHDRYVFCMECSMMVANVGQLSPSLVEMVRACYGPTITQHEHYLALQRCLLATWVTDVLAPLKTLAVEDPELAAQVGNDWHCFAISMDARTNKPPAVRKFMETIVRGLHHGAKKVVQGVENEFCTGLHGHLTLRDCSKQHLCFQGLVLKYYETNHRLRFPSGMHAALCVLPGYLLPMDSSEGTSIEAAVQAAHDRCLENFMGAAENGAEGDPHSVLLYSLLIAMFAAAGHLQADEDVDVGPHIQAVLGLDVGSVVNAGMGGELPSIFVDKAAPAVAVEEATAMATVGSAEAQAEADLLAESD